MMVQLVGRVLNRKQLQIQLSKLVASNSTKKVVWIKKFIIELGVVPTIEFPIHLYCENNRHVTSMYVF